MRPGSTSQVMLTQNTWLWPSENPHAVHEKPLHDQKLGVWVAISRWHIVGPLFLLHDFIGLLEEDQISYSWFQQDGGTAHPANNSMKLLNEIFGECVICRNLWPPRSPDLNPPDFYLWRAAKSAVYCDLPCMLNELKTAVTAYIRNISQADLQKVFANKIKRVQACIDVRGHHFQHKWTVTFRTHCSMRLEIYFFFNFSILYLVWKLLYLVFYYLTHNFQILPLSKTLYPNPIVYGSYIMLITHAHFLDCVSATHNSILIIHLVSVPACYCTT
jgi:hypothetical protein